jgi:hypothetical protein
MSGTLTEKSWTAMIDRCFRQTSKHYAKYGGVGVTVCEYLRASPVNLVILIGVRPAGKSIDRRNNLGSYTCGQCAECAANNWPMNVRWATPGEQARNRRTNKSLRFNGRTQLVCEWREEFGIRGHGSVKAVISEAIKRGMEVQGG